jgi:Uma2 family endonuclease
MGGADGIQRVAANREYNAAMEQETIEPQLMTIDEYLEFERQSREKHEYYGGEVVAMAGGSAMHSLIAMNLVREIGLRLKGKQCRVFGSDLRVRIPNHPTYVYPDVSVVCGPLEFDPRDKLRHTIMNPKLVIEVSSPSTESRDWVKKTGRYVSVPSIQEYLIVGQFEPQTFSISRAPGGNWSFTPVGGLEAALWLRSLEIEIPMAEVYAGVEFPTLPIEP